eukprot:Opistho-1_new@13309
MRTFVLDNGGSAVKAGWAGDAAPRIMPNSVTKVKSARRAFIGDQVDQCKDCSGLFFKLPVQKGYIVNWDTQMQIWDYVFSKDVCNVDAADTRLLLTEPPFNFKSVAQTTNEVVFEEYGFASCSRRLGVSLALMDAAETRAVSDDGVAVPSSVSTAASVVVDSGYSFTHVAPHCDGKKIVHAIRRIDVGGKLLTNYLKDIVSYRQLNVMEETHVVNQMKEDACFVSRNAIDDLVIAAKRGAENTIVCDYVLPNYTHIRRGFVRQMGGPRRPDDTGNEQAVVMNNERFMVPEVLFHPSDIGIDQGGIPETIVDSVRSAHTDLHETMYANILLVGGSAMFKGYAERVQADLRQLVDSDFAVRVHTPENPITAIWRGGARLAQSPDFAQRYAVTKAQYQEHGHVICDIKFAQ